MARRRRSNKSGYSSRRKSTPASPKRLDRSNITNQRFYYAPITDLDFQLRSDYGLPPQPPNLSRHRRNAIPRKNAPVSPPSMASKYLAKLIKRSVTVPVLRSPFDICRKRRERREVLFANNRGSGSNVMRVRPPRFRPSSTIRC